MVNKPKNIGTAAETAVVRVFQARGWPHAKRHALSGSKDIGDLNVHPQLVVEVKGGDAAKTASDAQIELWMRETETERENADADFGILVLQRKGVGVANAHRWWCVMTLDTLTSLAAPSQVGYPAYSTSRTNVEFAPVRMLLGDACDLLAAAGFIDKRTSV